MGAVEAALPTSKSARSSMEILGRSWHRVVGLCFLALVVVFVGFSLRPQCRGCSIAGARETSLRQDLYTLRTLIDTYTRDNGKRPSSLSDLVSSGYIKELPKDPMTERRDTWVVERSNDPHAPGIVDVHSSSTRRGFDGTRYADW